MSYTDFTKMMEQASPLEHRIKRSIESSNIPNCNPEAIVSNLSSWIAKQPKTIAGSIVVEKIIAEGLVDSAHRSKLLWSFLQNFAKELEKMASEDYVPHVEVSGKDAMMTVYFEVAKNLAAQSKLPKDKLKRYLENASKILQHSVANKAIIAETIDSDFTNVQTTVRLSQLQRAINAFYYVSCEALGPFEGDKALKQAVAAAKLIDAANDFPPDQLL